MIVKAAKGTGNIRGTRVQDWHSNRIIEHEQGEGPSEMGPYKAGQVL